MGKQKTGKARLLSDQLRLLIEDGPVSRYEIAKRSGVDASQLLRFVHGAGRLTTDSVDKVGTVLKLRFTIED